MEMLLICRKKKMAMFIFASCLIVLFICCYPSFISNAYELIFCHSIPNGNVSPLSDVYLALIGIPGMLPWCIPIKEYICILIDIKIQKQITVKVQGCEKPQLEFFDPLKFDTKKNKDKIVLKPYFYWKAKDASQKKYRFILFPEINNLKGKTINHSYNVSCYKYSKVVTAIEKIE